MWYAMCGLCCSVATNYHNNARCHVMHAQVVAGQLFLRLVDIWLEHADCIGHAVHAPLRQKVWALALCRALGANHKGMLERIPLLLNAVASILMDARSQVRACGCASVRTCARACVIALRTLYDREGCDSRRACSWVAVCWVSLIILHLHDTRRQAATAAELGRYLVDRAPGGRRGLLSSGMRRGGTTRSAASAAAATLKTPEGLRWRQALSKDYVHSADLAVEVRAAVAKSRTALGQAAVDAAVARAEPSTLEILRGQVGTFWRCHPLGV